MSAERETFIKVSDHMPDHPKIAGLSDRAFRVLVTGWCYASRYRTDGAIPAAVWRRMSTPKVSRELADAGLVDDEKSSESGGVEMHDYLKHQRSREHIEAVSEKRSVAGQKGGRPPKPKATKKQNASKVPSNEEPKHNPEDRAGTTYLPDRENPSGSPDRGSATTSPPGDDEPTESQRVQKITEDYVERRPMSNFPAARGCVLKAVKSGHADDDVRRALARIIAENRTLTVESLRIELEGHGRSSRPSTSDQSVVDTQALKRGTKAAMQSPHLVTSNGELVIDTLPLAAGDE